MAVQRRALCKGGAGQPATCRERMLNQPRVYLEMGHSARGRLPRECGRDFAHRRQRR
jgi:hypothetical protein